MKTLIAIALLVVSVCARPYGHGLSHRNPLLRYQHPESRSYDKSIRPNYNEEPAKVSVNIYFREIGPLNPERDEVQIQMTFRQFYNDPRLQHDKDAPITLVGEDAKRVWQPDTFFRFGRSSKIMQTFAPNQLAKISAEGDVTLSTRLIHTTGCQGLGKAMELGQSISCPIEIASYGLSADDVEYVWQEGEESPVKATDKQNMYLGNKFTFDGFEVNNKRLKTNTAEYSTLVVNLKLKSTST
ncbi:hypothetical protein TCAL_08462 [Tigriopus californicus]|uniref:Neurotransmitter-gated ion-channel ligand-binding domain-containing protein n=1 Tax=Tigriopus californicus TaxID=6832 RepID=A0A553N8Z8_TIGCA|nr:glutamate-gated chloride channel-like [Tigriopus californicus]TRY61911.1 hypothetical protein TCAL_08462 [Tigriopus californicus]|eukprot:TCALIF_08462-PA protein Name:"Similar to GluClalpha Glutamate-gated chloride channel (Drosophila melanogaster)" AED:0.06 eAED:0.06 QI:55/1/1/1/0.71/0.62/8/902/240